MGDSHSSRHMATTALALYPYDEEIVKDIFQPSDLSFPVGGVITNIQQHESGWWEGTHGTQRGTFPAVLVSTNVIGRAKCIHPYYAERLDELNIRKGDDIEIYERRQSGWLRVIVNGKGGLVPSTHVRELRAGVQHTPSGFSPPSMDQASAPKQPRAVLNSPVISRSPQMKAKPVCPPSLGGNMNLGSPVMTANHGSPVMGVPSVMGGGPPSPATVGPPPPATVGPPPMSAIPAKVNKFPSPAAVRMPTAAPVAHTPIPAPTPLPQAVAVAPPTSKFHPQSWEILSTNLSPFPLLNSSQSTSFVSLRTTTPWRFEVNPWCRN